MNNFQNLSETELMEIDGGKSWFTYLVTYGELAYNFAVGVKDGFVNAKTPK